MANDEVITRNRRYAVTCGQLKVSDTEPPLGGILKEQPERTSVPTKNRMDKTIRKYAFAELDEIKAQEYRYWQSRPVHERTDAVSELTQALYEMKGAAPDVPRLQRTLVRVERARR